MKQAIFYLERVIKDGKECIKVLDWKNILKRSELPIEYLNQTPCFYYSQSGQGIVIFYGEDGWIDNWEAIYRNSYIRKEHWEKLEKIMKQAGERLLKINQRRRWIGKFKTII